MHFTFPTGQLSIFLYFGIVFVISLIFSCVIMAKEARGAGKDGTPAFFKDFRFFTCFVLFSAVATTAFSYALYPDAVAAKTIRESRSEITSGIKNVYGVELSNFQYGTTFGNLSPSSFQKIREGKVVETASFNEGDKIYKFRVTDNKITLLETTVTHEEEKFGVLGGKIVRLEQTPTSDDDDFVEAEHVM